MDRYDPYLHRALVRDIVAAWAIAATLFAVLLVLPKFVLTDFADSAENGTKGTIAATMTHDTNGPGR